MAPTVAQVLARFKADVGQALSANVIEQVCVDLNHRHRERVLGPAATVHVFLTQVLHGNTACTHLPHLTGKQFSAASYCDARAVAAGAGLRPLIASPRALTCSVAAAVAVKTLARTSNLAPGRLQLFDERSARVASRLRSACRPEEKAVGSLSLTSSCAVRGRERLPATHHQACRCAPTTWPTCRHACRDA